MIRTWWERPSMLDDRERRIAVLNDRERARMSRYKLAEDQDRSLAAWSLARLVLGELLGANPAGLEFERSCLHCGHPDHGRPRVIGDPLHFSLSHSGDRVLLAVSADGPVGADVEVVNARHEDIARMVLHTDEKPTDLMRTWVRKEAVLKATGHGLGKAMTSFAVSAADEPARLLSWPDDVSLPERMELSDLPADEGYLAAIAVIR